MFSAKPEFVDPLPSTHTVPKGTPVLMMCTIRGSPDPTVTWCRHDKPLTHNDTDVTMEREGNECSLSVGQCELLDEGNYSCVIQNELGQTTSSTKLVVQGLYSTKETLFRLDSFSSSYLFFLELQ
jgi:hypothetical protein